MKRNCEKFKKLISAKIDDEIDALQSEKLNRHISECSECKDYYDDLCQMRALTKKLFSGYGSNGSLWDKISKKIVSENSNIVWYRKKRMPFWISSAVAATVLIFSMLFFYGNKYSGIQNKCIVEWVESKKSSVMVYEDVATKTTIIWMLSFKKNTDKNIVEGAVS